MSNLFEQFRTSWLTSMIGFGLFLFGTLVLFWNEGRAIHMTISLQEALEQAITLQWDKPFQSFAEGQLVHITGPLITGEPLTEMDYNIMVQAVKLKRRAQMYQWVEETIEQNYGESVASIQTEERTYYYTQEFKDKLIDSRSFYIRSGHENPTKFPIESKIYVAEHVKIGYYELGNEIKDRINTFQEVTSDTRPDDSSIKLHSGLYYHCNDIFNPEVGDIRLQFSLAGIQGEMYTVVGKLENNKIVSYRSSLGKKVLLVHKGEFALSDAFNQEHRSQRLTTWGIRFVGFVLIFFAVTCTSHLLTTILSTNRVTNNLAPNPANLFPSNLAFALSTALLISSIAWILHRPLLGASLLCTAISPALLRRNGVRYQRMD